MRKIMLSIMVASAAVAAVPASAQGWRPQAPVQRQIQKDISQLQTQVGKAAQRRTISQREAQTLRKDVLAVQQLYNRYSRNGLTRVEVTTLESRVNSVRRALRMERRDWDGRKG